MKFLSLAFLHARWKIIKWSVKQLIKPAPRESCILFLFVLVQGVLPGLSLTIMQQFVNWVARTQEEPFYFPYRLTFLWASMMVVHYCFAPVLAFVKLSLNEKVLAHCTTQLMEKANSFRGIWPFENASFLDTLQLLRKEAKSMPLNLAYIAVNSCTGIISLISMSVALAMASGWIPIGLVLMAIPHGIATLKLESSVWEQSLLRTPLARKMNWFSEATFAERSARELRLFGFGAYFIKKYQQLAQSIQTNIHKFHLKHSVCVILLSSLTVCGNLGLFLWLLINSVEFFDDIGAPVMVFQGFVLIQAELVSIVQDLAMLYPVLNFFGRFKSFLSKPVTQDLYVNPRPVDLPKDFHSISFEDVSFSYPDGRVVLQNINLTIRAKEKVALVGGNGSGKSTLAKLLMRFYDPSSGRITVDGIDLRDIDVAVWRKKVSTVFQDFVQYPLTVAENMALGNLQELMNKKKLEVTSRKAGFEKTMEKLNKDYQKLLGKEFGGTGLSGGEWQKLAMARAFMKEEVALLILDEPTAALDPRSEAEVFQKFAENAAGKTTLLITHRLGSVSMADRIVVLKEGRIVEEGTHLELLQNKQEYAALFDLQAAQYVTASVYP